MSFCKYVLYLGWMLCFCTNCSPQDTLVSDQYVRLLKVSILPTNLDGNSEVKLHFEIAEGYHIMTSKQTEDNIIPTQLFLKSNEAIWLGQPQFSLPVRHSLQGLDHPIMIYEGTFTVIIPFIVKTGITPTIEGSLYYQACNAQKCFFPKSLDFQKNI